MGLIGGASSPIGSSILGGYINADAAKRGISGPSALTYSSVPAAGSSPVGKLLNVQAPQQTGGVPSANFGARGAGAGKGALDYQTMLTQLLQAGPTLDQNYLTTSLEDLASQETRARKDLQSRFAGLGRPLSSSEYTDQESQLLDVFARARNSARTNASRAGLDIYNTSLNPLLKLLQLAQQDYQTQVG